RRSSDLRVQPALARAVGPQGLRVDALGGSCLGNLLDTDRDLHGGQLYPAVARVWRLEREGRSVRSLLVLLLLSVAVGTAAAQPARVPRLVLPVVGQAMYRDDFGEPRGKLRHQGIDIIPAHKAIASAAEPGTIEFWTT